MTSLLSTEFDYGDGYVSVLRNFAVNLQRWMDTNGYDQVRLAKAVKCSQPTISEWTSGIRLPRPEKWEALSLVTGMTYEEMVRSPGIEERDRDPVARFLANQLRALGYEVINPQDRKPKKT